MHLKKRISYALVSSATAIITSIFLPFIPCKSPSNIPSRSFDWALCNLNPDTTLANTSTKYFGYTNSISDSFIILIAIVFVTTIIISHFIKFDKT